MPPNKRPNLQRVVIYDPNTGTEGVNVSLNAENLNLDFDTTALEDAQAATTGAVQALGGTVATQGTLEQVLAAFGALATEGKLEQVRALLGGTLTTAISGSNIRFAHAVTPGASALSGVAANGAASSLYVGAEGDVTITLEATGSLTFSALAAGMWHPMPPFTHVTAATATGLIAGY